MPEELTQAKIFDSNGTKYRIGYDPHGWITIQVGEMYYDEEAEEEKFWPYERDDDISPQVQMPAALAQEMAEYIESLT
jgi:hypothetical protein